MCHLGSALEKRRQFASSTASPVPWQEGGDTAKESSHLGTGDFSSSTSVAEAGASVCLHVRLSPLPLMALQ